MEVALLSFCFESVLERWFDFVVILKIVVYNSESRLNGRNTSQYKAIQFNSITIYSLQNGRKVESTPPSTKADHYNLQEDRIYCRAVALDCISLSNVYLINCQLRVYCMYMGACAFGHQWACTCTCMVNICALCIAFCGAERSPVCTYQACRLTFN